MEVIRTRFFDDSLLAFEPRVQRQVDQLLTQIEHQEYFHEVVRDRRQTYRIDGSDVWRWKVNRADRLLALFATSQKGHLAFVPLGLYNHATYDEMWDPGNLPVLNRLAERAKEDSEVSERLVAMDNRDERVATIVPHRAIGLRLGLVDLVPTVGRDVCEETRTSSALLRKMKSNDPRLFDEVTRQVLNPRFGGGAPVSIGGLVIESAVDGIDGVTSIRSENEKSPTVLRRYDRPRTEGSWRECVAASVSAVDPFLVHDERQKEILTSFSDRYRALPALIDGPGGSGKTTLLLAILRGVLQNRSFYGEDIKVRLLTINRSHVETLRRATVNYLHLVGGYETEVAEQFAIENCQSLDEFLVSYLTEEQRAGFAPRDKVRWSTFSAWYEKHFPRTRDSAAASWSAIRILIGGDHLSREEDDPLRLEETDAMIKWFSGLNANRQHGLSMDSFKRGLEVLRRYVAWKDQENRWDDTDLVRAVLESMASSEQPSNLIDLILVDEAQDLTPDQIRLILRAGSCIQYELHREVERDGAGNVTIPLPFLFAADDLQTINPSGFTWSFFSSIVFEETRALLNQDQGIKKEPIQLTTNYRMRGLPYLVSNSIRRWIDPTRGLPPDPLQDGVSGPWKGPDEEVDRLFQLADVVIIPDNLTNEQIETWVENEPFLSRVLKNGFERRKVISTHDAKGQEWSMAINYGFARFVRSRRGSEETRYSRQITYVGASRARDNCVWYDQPEDRDWFWWDVHDPTSPAQHLSEPQVVTSVGQLQKTTDTSDLFSEAMIRLVDAMSEDRDRNEQLALVNMAVYQFGRSGKSDHARVAEEIERLIKTGTGVIALTETPEELRRIAAIAAIKYKSWGSFRAIPTPPGDERSLLTFGMLKLAESEENPTRAFDILLQTSNEDLSTIAKQVATVDESFQSIQVWLTTFVIESLEATPLSHVRNASMSVALENLANVASHRQMSELLTVSRACNHDWVECLVEASTLGHEHELRRRVSLLAMIRITGVRPNGDAKTKRFDLREANSDECRQWLEKSSSEFIRLDEVIGSFMVMSEKSLSGLTEYQSVALVEASLEKQLMKLKEICSG